mgnify:CR=1 FL=1
MRTMAITPQGTAPRRPRGPARGPHGPNHRRPVARRAIPREQRPASARAPRAGRVRPPCSIVRPWPRLAGVQSPTDSDLRDLFAATRTIAILGANTEPGKPAFYVPEYLAAHAAGVDRARVMFTETDPEFYSRFRALVERRAQRIPLQHLIGTAAFGPVEVQVGPGVFIPRPETEALLEWAMNQPLPPSPVIVDLCTGSGALALALAHTWPQAQVVAVEKSPEALVYARRNCAGSAVDVLEADVTLPSLLADRNGTVDLLVSNPPYIPEGAELDPEVADHDPAAALFGGPDGMSVIVPMIVLASI